MAANLTLTYGALNLTAAPFAIAFGFDPGAPQNVTTIVDSLLQDGEIELTDRTSNRTLQFDVLIEGANLTTLATAEAALMAEADKVLNLLTVDPGDSAPAGVYETFRAQVTLVRDDSWEIARMRRYTLTVKAAPYVRSVAEVVTPALAASGTTTTLVDNGSATTGWTGTIGGVSSSPSVVSGAVGITSTALVGTVAMTLTRTGSITTSATPYLMVDWRGMANNPLTAVGDGVSLERISQSNSPTAGYTRTWFKVAASSVSVVTFSQSSNVSPVPQARPLFIDNINRTDVRPSLGSARQLLRTIAVTGTARTPGRLAIEHATTALGYTIAYVWSGGAEGMSPPLRPYRISGGTVTTDATKISGAYENIKSTTIIYDIPLSQLSSGLHTLMMKLVTGSTVSGSTTTLTYTSRTQLNGTTVSPVATGTITVPNTTLSGAGYTVAGRLLLPTQYINADSGGFQRITLTTTTTLADLSIDEGWLFNTTIGQLTVVWSDGSGTATLGGSSNRIWINPATIDTPRPSITIGFNADRSDARFPQEMAAWQQPQFVPPSVKVFTVTPYATDAGVTLAYFPHWDFNPAS